jgi:hypothetical protein
MVPRTIDIREKSNRGMTRNAISLARNGKALTLTIQ